MPSITGGDSTGRDYAPHMWVLREDGDPHCEENYGFVGNATAFWEDYSDPTVPKYHVGVTALGEVLCERGMGDHSTYNCEGISSKEIPDFVIRKAILEGARNACFMDGQRLLTAFGTEIPEDLEPTNPSLMFNGSPEEQEEQARLVDRWRAFGEKIKEQYQKET